MLGDGPIAQREATPPSTGFTSSTNDLGNAQRWPTARALNARRARRAPAPRPAPPTSATPSAGRRPERSTLRDPAQHRLHVQHRGPVDGLEAGDPHAQPVDGENLRAVQADRV